MTGPFILPINYRDQALSSHLLTSSYHDNTLLDAELNLHILGGWNSPYCMNP